MKRFFPILGAGLMAWLIGAGCATPEPPHDPPIDAKTPMEPGEAFAFGRSIAARLSTRNDLVENAKAAKYVAQVGGVVAAASGLPDPYDGWRFYIVNDKHVSTYSAPGGFVFITTGALKALTSEDALAAMLAQEMAHSALRHALDGEQTLDVRPVAESWPRTPDWGPARFREICDSAANKAGNGWTESQENAASEWAKRALGRSGYAPDDSGVPEARKTRFASELADFR